MPTLDELKQMIQRWASGYPSVNAAATALVEKLESERLYRVGVVTATKRINGDIENISYREALSLWSVLHEDVNHG